MPRSRSTPFSSCADPLPARTLARITDVAASDWDRLAPAGNPFLSHAFLRILEESGSVSARTGWQPFHLVVERGGELVAAAPLYVKGHSYGEYVFDHGWASAYERAGGAYYPKLQSAVPFTPVPGPRLLAADAEARAELVAGLASLPGQLGVSSLHVTFCSDEEAAELAEHGLLRRRSIQFHWHNQGFRDFADWLDTLKSAKRKMVRKEREQVQAAGIEVEALHGKSLGEKALGEFYPFYLATVDKRWGSAYLTRDFFRRLRELRDKVVLVTARHEGRMVGAALNLLGSDCLYGRNWGCLEEFKFLHFEACYYQAIEFAIRHGLPRVEAGAQGIHKLHRGYAPVWTHSAHQLRHEGLRQAVARFLRAEEAEQEREIAIMTEMLPYRQA